MLSMILQYTAFLFYNNQKSGLNSLFWLGIFPVEIQFLNSFDPEMLTDVKIYRVILDCVSYHLTINFYALPLNFELDWF